MPLTFFNKCFNWTWTCTFQHSR